MSANIINKSGSTSTFIPGGNGNSGKRAAVTFYGTYNEESISNPITFILNDSSVTISNIYGSSITPDIDDCIVYSEPNNTYLLYITSKNQDIYNVNISEIWNTQSSQSEHETDISNIALNVTCVNNISQTYHGFKSNIADKILKITNIYKASFTGESNPDSLYINSVCGFTFNITSLNTIPLGKYKLQMEFITDWISPGMDTRIAKKFQTQKIYSGSDNYPATEEKCTLRGYITNYSCKGSTEEYSKYCPNCGNIKDNTIKWINGWWTLVCSTCHQESPLPKNPEVVSENFDDEKLDNFEVTIKDYSDGIGEQSYQITTFIPIDVLKNAYNAGHPYTCLLYLYVDGANGSKEKIFMRDMSSTFNTAVLEADSSIYGTNNDGPNDDGPNDDGTNDPLSTKYAGTAHSIIYLGNSEIIQKPSFDTYPSLDTNTSFPSIIEEPNDTIIGGYEQDYYIDDVYVNDISIQTKGGSGDWCRCTYDRVSHKLTYKAISNNNTGSMRDAQFVHTTKDNTLSRGPNAGSAAMPNWTVIVHQLPTSTGTTGGGKDPFYWTVTDGDENKFYNVDSENNLYNVNDI